MASSHVKAAQAAYYLETEVSRLLRHLRQVYGIERLEALKFLAAELGSRCRSLSKAKAVVILAELSEWAGFGE